MAKSLLMGKRPCLQCKPTVLSVCGFFMPSFGPHLTAEGENVQTRDCTRPRIFGSGPFLCSSPCESQWWAASLKRSGMAHGFERDIRISFSPFHCICRTEIKVSEKGHLSSLSSELMEKVLEIFGIVF